MNQQDKFYTENENNDVFKFKKSKIKHLSICSYNVHGWVNLNKNINIITNFNNICDFLSNIECDILVLQEVCLLVRILPLEFILEKLYKFGYVDHILTPNGGCFLSNKTTDYILILGKKEFQYKENVDVTKFMFKRSLAVFEYDDIKMLAVHLEIGDRFHHLENHDPKRIKIEKNNEARRISQLSRLLEFHPDITVIVGDFNFSPQDPEFQWLINKNFKYYGELSNTTPWNRTDMIFINNKIKVTSVNNYTVKINYSDHLPILGEFVFNL